LDDPDSLDEYPSQVDAGEKVFPAHQPNFFILPFAFLLLPCGEKAEVICLLLDDDRHENRD
jgi:hypothetical protein